MNLIGQSPAPTRCSMSACTHYAVLSEGPSTCRYILFGDGISASMHHLIDELEKQSVKRLLWGRPQIETAQFSLTVCLIFVF